MELSKLSLHLDRSRIAVRFNPERDWFILIGCLVAVLAALVVWNISVFDTIAGGGVLGSPAVTPEPFFNNTSLDTVNAIFQDRAAEQVKYQNDGYTFADPSQ